MNTPYPAYNGGYTTSLNNSPIYQPATCPTLEYQSQSPMEPTRTLPAPWSTVGPFQPSTDATADSQPQSYAVRPHHSEPNAFYGPRNAHNGQHSFKLAPVRRPTAPPDSFNGYVANDPFKPSISHSMNNRHEDVATFDDIPVFAQSHSQPSNNEPMRPTVPSTRPMDPQFGIYQPPYDHPASTSPVNHPYDPYNPLYTPFVPPAPNQYPSWKYIVVFALYTLLGQVYLHFLLRLPSLYFGRVALIFEEADMTLPEIKKMALETASKGKKALFAANMNLKPEDVPPAYESLKHTWENFIDSVMREWKTFNIISVLLLSAILTILQIESAAADPVTRYTALFSLICALISLLYGCMYIIRFGTMRKTYKAAEWALEGKKSKTVIWWNVWVLLAMPAIWLTWSIILYVVCIMSFVWRTGSRDDQPPEALSAKAAMAIRIVITVILCLGTLYGILIFRTFRRYGDAMDRAWTNRIDDWLREKPFSSHHYHTHPTSYHQPSHYPTVPAWAPTIPTNSAQYPLYPSSPYSGAPFIPNMWQPTDTPGVSPSAFPPWRPGGIQTPPEGFTSDYTGHPGFAFTPYGGHAGLPPGWPTPEGPPASTPLPAPAGMPRGPPGAVPVEPLRPAYPQFQHPISTGGHPGFGSDTPWPGMPGHGIPRPAPMVPWGIHAGGLAPAPHPDWPAGAQPAPPRAPLHRSEADMADRVDHFAMGEHYGPVLEPFLTRVVKADVRINPLLQPPDKASDRPFLEWNMLFSSNNIHRSNDPAHVSWANGRGAPATFPRVTSLRIVLETIPWMITVTALNPDVGVTCGEVIEGIYHDLNRMCVQSEFDALPIPRKRVVGEAYKHNRSRAYGAPGGILGSGLRRLDFLGQNTLFGGVESNDHPVRQICGDALPCTFVLKCILVPQKRNWKHVTDQILTLLPWTKNHLIFK